MVEKICDYLTKKIRKEMPDVNDERAEVINYGLQMIIREIPKMFLAIIIAFALGSIKLVGITLLVLIPYRGFTGGFHLKTHIGCFICTTIMYCLPAILTKIYVFEGIYQYMVIAITTIFAIIMIGIFAPADTVNLPIISRKERKIKKILSYIILIISMISAIAIKDSTISSAIIYTILMQTISITKPAYKISKCEYGYINYIQGNLDI